MNVILNLSKCLTDRVFLCSSGTFFILTMHSVKLVEKKSDIKMSII